MHKLNIILVIVCMLMLQQVKAKKITYVPDRNYTQFEIHYESYQKPNYTQEVYLNDVPYTLSRNDSHIFINHDRYSKPCNLSFKNLSFSFLVAPFRDKIILWDQKTKDFDVEGLTLLLINPSACNYTEILVPKDDIPKYHPPHMPQVVTYKNMSINYFDVFFASRNVCMPCRFDDEGTKLEMDYQLENETLPPLTPYIIRPLVKSTPDAGFFYSYSFNNGTMWTKLSILNSNFTSVNTTYVNHTVDEVAIADGTRNIATCYKKEDYHYTKKTQAKVKKILQVRGVGVYCDVYNKQLEHIYHVKLDVPRDQYVNGILPKIDRAGQVCVAVPHISYTEREKNYSLTLFQFDIHHESFEPVSTIHNNIDEECGYNLKVRGSRMMSQKCRT